MSDTHPDSPPRDDDVHPDSPPRVVQSDDERQDEALEESFPASDPPSAKHIT